MRAACRVQGRAVGRHDVALVDAVGAGLDVAGVIG
jgi:hypothetical protein